MEPGRAPVASVVLPSGASEQQPRQDDRRFRRMLRQASSYASFRVQEDGRVKSIFNSGRPVVCMTLLFICSIMLIVEFSVNEWRMESFEVNPTFGVSVETLLALGAKRADLILDGDWYRLIAPIFLHAGILHFLFNMFALYAIGFSLEKQFGSLAIGLIIIVGGIQGVVWSAIFSPIKVGVGASGAIFALFGSAWSELIQNWSLYKGQQCIAITQLIIATAVNLVIGLMPFLDNFAHLAGFCTGVIIGFGVLISNRYTRNGDLKDRKRYQTTLQILSVIITPIMFVVSLFILYFGVEVEEWCSWCAYLSCVPFPPGDDPWWTCDDCADAGVTAFSINSTHMELTCPDTSTLITLTPPELETDTAVLIRVCQNLCLA